MYNLYSVKCYIEKSADDELNHIGIKGMKWGKRKSRLTKEQRDQQNQLKEIEKRNKMLSSPKLLAKNLDKFSKEEIDSAVTRMRLNRDLKQMELSEIKSGSEYVNAYLAIGTSAVAAYKLYESPLGQRIAGSIKKALE